MAPMHQHQLELHQPPEMHLELRVPPAGVLAHLAAGEAIVLAVDALALAAGVDHLAEHLEQPPGLRRQLVEAAAARGSFRLGLATGNFEPAAYAKLRRGNLARYFEFGGFGSDSGDRVELTRLAVERGREQAGQ